MIQSFVFVVVPFLSPVMVYPRDITLLQNVISSSCFEKFITFL